MENPSAIEQSQPPLNKGAFRTLKALAVLSLVWGLLWFLRLRWASPDEALLTTVLYTLCCLPTILFIGGHKVRVPFMPMWGLMYFLMFGMPMLDKERQQVLGFSSQEPVTDALQLGILGAALCLLTFYSPLGRWIEKLAPKIRAPWNPKRAPMAGVVLSLIGLALHYYRLVAGPVPDGLRQLLSIGTQLAMVGMLTLFLLQLRGLSSWKLTFFLWGIVVPAEVLLGLGSGFIAPILRSLAPLLFCFAAERRKIPWVALLIVAMLILPFAGETKKEYRSYAWMGGQPDVEMPKSPVRKGLFFIELVKMRLTEQGTEMYTVAAETAEARVSHLDVLITVMELTPSTIPYWGGKTYSTLLWAPIPRALAPSKPTKRLGQDFGHRYGLLDPWDESTSLDLPHQVVEMYINFGVPGVVIGMLLMGLIYRFILAALKYPDSGERALIVGCALFANMMYLEVDFSLVFGGMAWYLLILFFFTRMFMAKTREVDLAEAR